MTRYMYMDLCISAVKHCYGRNEQFFLNDLNDPPILIWVRMLFMCALCLTEVKAEIRQGPAILPSTPQNHLPLSPLFSTSQCCLAPIFQPPITSDEMMHVHVYSLQFI